MDPRSRFAYSETSLLLSEPIWDLPDPVRSALRAWCRAHRIDPDAMLVDRAIERDPDAVSLTWYVETPTGVHRRTVYEAEPRGSWPAPFPDAVSTWARRRGEATQPEGSRKELAARRAC